MRLRWSPTPPTLCAVLTLQPGFPQWGVGWWGWHQPLAALTAPGSCRDLPAQGLSCSLSWLHSQGYSLPVGAAPSCPQVCPWHLQEGPRALFMGAQCLLGGFMCLWLQRAPAQRQWPFPGTWHLQRAKAFGDRTCPNQS